MGGCWRKATLACICVYVCMYVCCVCALHPPHGQHRRGGDSDPNVHRVPAGLHCHVHHGLLSGGHGVLCVWPARPRRKQPGALILDQGRLGEVMGAEERVLGQDVGDPRSPGLPALRCGRRGGRLRRGSRPLCRKVIGWRRRLRTRLRRKLAGDGDVMQRHGWREDPGVRRNVVGVRRNVVVVRGALWLPVVVQHPAQRCRTRRRGWQRWQPHRRARAEHVPDPEQPAVQGAKNPEPLEEGVKVLRSDLRNETQVADQQLNVQDVGMRGPIEEEGKQGNSIPAAHLRNGEPAPFEVAVLRVPVRRGRRSVVDLGIRR